MPLQWTEDLTVGVATIDEQHRALIDEFNRLLEACHRHEGREMVPVLIDFLDKYVKEHFADEERCMERAQYPQIDEHKRLHREFIGKIDGLHQQLDESGSSMSLIIQLNETLLRWFINHIKRVDKQLGAFLQTRDI